MNKRYGRCVCGVCVCVFDSMYVYAVYKCVVCVCVCFCDCVYFCSVCVCVCVCVCIWLMLLCVCVISGTQMLWLSSVRSTGRQGSPSQTTAPAYTSSPTS